MCHVTSSFLMPKHYQLGSGKNGQPSQHELLLPFFVRLTNPSTFLRGLACPKKLSSVASVFPIFASPMPSCRLVFGLIAFHAGIKRTFPGSILLFDFHLRVTIRNTFYFVVFFDEHNFGFATVTWFTLSDTSRRVQRDILALIHSHAVIVLQNSSDYL